MPAYGMAPGLGSVLFFHCHCLCILGCTPAQAVTRQWQPLAAQAAAAAMRARPRRRAGCVPPRCFANRFHFWLRGPSTRGPFLSILVTPFSVTPTPISGSSVRPSLPPGLASSQETVCLMFTRYCHVLPLCTVLNSMLCKHAANGVRQGANQERMEEITRQLARLVEAISRCAASKS